MHLKAETDDFSLEEQTKQNEKKPGNHLLFPMQQLGNHFNTTQFAGLQLNGHWCHLLMLGPTIPPGKTTSGQSASSKAKRCSYLKQPRIRFLLFVNIRRVVSFVLFWLFQLLAVT